MIIRVSARRRDAQQNATISIEYLCRIARERERERKIKGAKCIDLCRLIGYYQVELTLY